MEQPRYKYDAYGFPTSGSSVTLPCGARAHFDKQSSTYSHRCGNCFAIVGSSGMPKRCYDLMKDKIMTTPKATELR